MKYCSKTLSKIVDDYDLKELYVGDLSRQKNARYTHSKISNEWPEDTDGNYVLEFNFFDNKKANWIVFEKSCENKEEAKKIQKDLFDKRIWDSRNVFFVKNDEILMLI